METDFVRYEVGIEFPFKQLRTAWNSQDGFTCDVDEDQSQSAIVFHCFLTTKGF
jgi:hypothetical protein